MAEELINKYDFLSRRSAHASTPDQNSDIELVAGAGRHLAVPNKKRNWATEMHPMLLYKEDVVYVRSASRNFSFQPAVAMELLTFTFVTLAIKAVFSAQLREKHLLEMMSTIRKAWKMKFAPRDC